VQNPVLISALDRPTFDRTQLCLFTLFLGHMFIWQVVYVTDAVD